MSDDHLTGDQQQLETQDELIDELRCRIGDLEDENQALRDECERLRERPAVPNLDAMTVEELDVAHKEFDQQENAYHLLLRYAQLMAAAKKGNVPDYHLEWRTQIYAALPPWAKFRERE